ncbi:hypothetical protein [Thermovibrio sp.]
MFRELLNYTCYLLYAVSAVLALIIITKVVDVRSKCTEERSRISSVLAQIKELKDENNRLMVEYYSKVRPEVIDKKSSDLKNLHEDQLEYVK